MSIINIETFLGLVRIQVTKNDFTDEFIEQFKEMVSLFPLRYRSIIHGSCFRIPESQIDNLIKQFSDAVDELNDMGTNFPYVIDAKLIKQLNNESQDLMNKLHRSFTTAHQCHDYERPLHWNDKFPSDFTVTNAQMDRMLHLTDQINSYVHNTEIYIKTDRKSYEQDNLAKQLEVRADSYINEGIRIIKKWFTVIKPEHYQYYSDSDEFDVWVGKDILGKDYIIAYYEHDDASEWDVDHSIGYSGKLALDCSTVTRRDIAKSDDFRSWLEETNVDYTPAMCGMPVGTIIEGRDLVSRLHSSSSGDNPITSITFE